MNIYICVGTVEKTIWAREELHVHEYIQPQCFVFITMIHPTIMKEWQYGLCSSCFPCHVIFQVCEVIT